MDLEAVSVFVKVVQAGGFSKAAKLLRMPNSTVSAKVALLEKSLGVTLLQRTTRSVNVTEAGEVFFQRCVHALDELQSARNEVSQEMREPQGELRITAPVDIGHWILPQLVRRYCERYPKMEVELIVTNRRVDLIGEGVDLAIRVGDLEDSSLMARKMRIGAMGFWASPEYLIKHPAPTIPEQLQEHDFLAFTGLRLQHLKLAGPQKNLALSLRGRIRVDDPETVKMLVLQDLGIGLIPNFQCEEDAARGRMVRLLPEWHYELSSCSIVYPAQRFVPAKVRAFIDLVQETL